MKTAILAVATGFFLACAVYARLGETRQQIEARYGPALGFEKLPDDSGWPAASVACAGSYQTNGFDFLVMFDAKTNSVREKITRAHRPGQFTDPTFTEDEIRAILAANRGGSQWSAPTDERGNTYWKRADGAVAVLVHIEAAMSLVASNLAERLMIEATREREKQLSGF